MKVGIVGTGFVGAATAFALMLRGIASKIVLIDINKEKSDAEAEDIAHAAPFAYANKVYSGDYKDLSYCDVVIISAGSNQKPGETRLDLLERNVKIFQDIIPRITKNAPDSILLITTNPVDIMTEVTLRLSGFPQHRIIGSGTVLDTARFRTLLGEYLGISPKSVHANVLGEHGDSEVLIWSNGDAGTLSIEKLASDLKKPLTDEIKAKISGDVRNAAYKIIKGKIATYYGISGALARICQAIGTHELAILPVSSHHKEAFGVEDVCISLPTVVGKNGVMNVLHPDFNPQEAADLHYSAKTLKEYSQKALEMIAKK